MKVKRYVLVSAAVLAAGAGGGAAIAASGGDERQQTEQSILAGAAKRLNVTPEALRGALSAAEDAQLDQAVKDGKLTQEQADAIKKHRAQDGSVLGGVGGGPGHGGHGFGGPGHGPGLRFKAGPGEALDAAASALGISRADLVKKVRAGQSIADVAKAEGKSLDDVKQAITAGVTKELDQAVADKKLTSAQRDDILKRLSEHLDDLVNGKRPAGAPRFEKRGGPPAGALPRGWR